MEPEEQSPSLLVGWLVVDVGRRQAWPFVNFANPRTGREVRLYIDTTFTVAPGSGRLAQHDDAVLNALDTLSGQTVSAASTSNGDLRLNFADANLIVAGTGNELTSHSPWWIGAAPSA